MAVIACHIHVMSFAVTGGNIAIDVQGGGIEILRSLGSVIGVVLPQTGPYLMTAAPGLNPLNR